MRLRWSTLDITVPDSQLQNTETVQSNVEIRANRGGQTLSVADWPKNTINHYSIKCMNATEYNNIRNFLIQSAADEITLTDHDGTDWLGIVTTPIPELVILGTQEFDLEFEFMGSPV